MKINNNDSNLVGFLCPLCKALVTVTLSHTHGEVPVKAFVGVANNYS